jgi:apolipoprotein N-acyltransferase
MILLSILSGLIIGVAFLFPETYSSLILGLVGTGLFVFAFTTAQNHLKKSAILFGLSLSAVGFHWLPTTINRFGGFSPFLSYLLFALFCLASSLQYVFFAVLYRKLKDSYLSKCYMALPLAWLVPEYLIPQLFPWRFVHTQVLWRGFASLAEVFGVVLLNFIFLIFVCWFVDVFSRAIKKDSRPLRNDLLILLSFVLLLSYGIFLEHQVASEIELATKVKVGLVQGNILPEDKRSGDLQDALAKYQQLSISAGKVDLLLWPETVFLHWTPERLRNVLGTEFDPAPDLKTPLLYGLLSFRPKQQDNSSSSTYKSEDDFDKFNSAAVRGENGEIIGMTRKQVLMPFGEYLPFADIFPWLKSLSPMTGDFQAGVDESPITIPLEGERSNLKVMPLICYEDLISSVSSGGTQKGAELLVNMTNDAWYGDSVAPYQHHLLALWRAIETRRTLLRVTNTGLTAVVSPLGVTTDALPTFQAGVLVATVPLLNRITIFARFGVFLSWFFVGFSLFNYCLQFSKRDIR